jgi:hypothetical protein
LQIVAGFGLKGLKPRVWDPTSSYYIHDLESVMVSYGDFHRCKSQWQKASNLGLHQYLNIPQSTKVYLDNGAFSFINKNQEVPVDEYEKFVKSAKPDWYPIPQDFIPIPKMSDQEQEECYQKTMKMNYRYHQGSYVPVIHISQYFEKYVASVTKSKRLAPKTHLALGGIVPNLLRASKAFSYDKLIKSLVHFREKFYDKKLHVFGIGGTATLHIAALLQINSVDSTGWRNRAARGLIQLPGTGDRIVADLGNWRGRYLSSEEEKKLEKCQCPACKMYGRKGLGLNGSEGFCNRATHNLWVLIEEERQISEHLNLEGDYESWYVHHLDNTTYKPLIEKVLQELQKSHKLT